MKISKHLTFVFVIASLVVSIGFSIDNQFYTQENEITFVVTVESNEEAMPVHFNIAISKDRSETNDFKLLENQRTPFTIELENDDHLIVVHKTEEQGSITSQVEKHISGKSKASASAGGNVITLTTTKNGKVTSFGMN